MHVYLYDDYVNDLNFLPEYHYFLVVAIEEDTKQDIDCWCQIRLDQRDLTVSKGLVGSIREAIPSVIRKLDENLTYPQLKEISDDLVEDLCKSATPITKKECFDLKKGIYPERCLNNMDDIII